MLTAKFVGTVDVPALALRFSALEVVICVLAIQNHVAALQKSANLLCTKRTVIVDVPENIRSGNN